MTTSTFIAAAALVAAALATAPSALAEPLPNPDPVPVPGVGVEGQTEASTGGVVSGGEARVSAPSVGTNSSADPLTMVPNINGDPCTGQWESTVCYAMHYDSPPAVVPRSTVSSSP